MHALSKRHNTAVDGFSPRPKGGPSYVAVHDNICLSEIAISCYVAAMKISLAATHQNFAIRAYEKGQLIINEQAYRNNLIIMPEQLIPDWRPQSVESLTVADFDELLALKPGMIILGTGERQIFPSAALYAEVTNAGIGVEVMNTPAACRTYNILMSEGRSIAAALMML